MNKEPLATYLSKISPNGQMHLASVKGGVVEAQDGLVKLYDQEHVDEADEMIANRADWRQHFEKIDFNAAQAVVAADIAKRRQEAAKGGVSTAQMGDERPVHSAGSAALKAMELAARAGQSPEKPAPDETQAFSTDEIARATGGTTKVQVGATTTAPTPEGLRALLEKQVNHKA